MTTDITPPVVKSLSPGRSGSAETIPEAERKKPPEFWPKLHHRPITVRLTGAPSISGSLEGFSTYEIVVRTAAGKEVMIPKHSIASIDLPADWRRRAPEAESGGEAA